MLPWPPAAPILGDRRATRLSVSTLTLIFSGVSRKDGKSSRRTSLTSVSPNEVHAAHARLPGLSTRADHCAPISRLVASPYTLPELWRSLTTSTKIIMKFCVPTWVCTFAMYSFPWLNTCTRHLPVPIARHGQFHTPSSKRCTKFLIMTTLVLPSNTTEHTRK